MSGLVVAGLIALSPLQVCVGGGLEPADRVQVCQVVVDAAGEASLPECDWYSVEEDSPYFDCRVNGNQICGPDNPWGHAPGYYGLGDCTNLAGASVSRLSQADQFIPVSVPLPYAERFDATTSFQTTGRIGGSIY